MRTQSLFKLAWPIFIEQALIIMVGVVNVYILSRYDSSAAAAVEGCTQVLWNVFLVFAVISLGTSVLVAQNVGATEIANALIRRRLYRCCSAWDWDYPPALG